MSRLRSFVSRFDQKTGQTTKKTGQKNGTGLARAIGKRDVCPVPLSRPVSPVQCPVLHPAGARNV